MGAVSNPFKKVGQKIGLLDSVGQSTIIKSLDPSNSLALSGVSYGLGRSPSKTDVLGGLVKPGAFEAMQPPKTPDLADQLLRAMERANADRFKTGTTRESTFKKKPGGGY